MKPKRKRDFTGMFIMAVLLSFILPLGYLVVRIVSYGGTEEVRSREDYVLMLLQCLLGIAAIVLPLRLIRQKTLQIPRVMLVLYIAFCFALAMGAVWEIYEFTMDSVFGTNMQKYMLDNGTALIGQAALQDTMKDIIVDAIGALVMSTIGYISLKYKKGWVEKLTIRFHVNKPEKAGKTKKGKDE